MNYVEVDEDASEVFQHLVRLAFNFLYLPQ